MSEEEKDADQGDWLENYDKEGEVSPSTIRTVEDWNSFGIEVGVELQHFGFNEKTRVSVILGYGEKGLKVSMRKDAAIALSCLLKLAAEGCE